MDPHNPIIDLSRCPPSYGGCQCGCHTDPNVTHMAACCTPSEELMGLSNVLVGALYNKHDKVIVLENGSHGTITQVAVSMKDQQYRYFVEYIGTAGRWMKAEEIRRRSDKET